MRPKRRFLDLLPTDEVRAVYRAWLGARTGAGLPRLSDFAPIKLPPRLIPWILVYHLRRDGELVYGLAGDELVRLFHENPKGKRILEYATPEERAARVAVILRVIKRGMPVWFTAMLLFQGKEHRPIGRLCLPVATAGGEGMLLLYVGLDAAPLPRLSPAARITFDEHDLHWCTAADLEPTRGG